MNDTTLRERQAAYIADYNARSRAAAVAKRADANEGQWALLLAGADDETFVSSKTERLDPTKPWPAV
jgi:hypothetical protein